MLSNDGCTLEEAVTDLVIPAVETLTGARERVYLSPDIVQSALKLVTSLIQLLLSQQQLTGGWSYV